LVAAHSVTSPHTIDPRIDRLSLHSFADRNKLTLSARVDQLLRDNPGE
jgi:hypothetical protein